MRKWDAYRTVDPSSLSIRTLASVLSCRGIQTRGVFERDDLLDLVRSSGECAECPRLSTDRSEPGTREMRTWTYMEIF